MNVFKHSRQTIVAAALLASHMLALCAADEPAATALFTDQIAPLLAARCVTCHGPNRAESGYRLDRREQAFAGGDSGAAAILPGLPAASALFRRISSANPEDRMPSDGPPLSAAEQLLVGEWIEAGAIWPESLAALPEALSTRSATAPEHSEGHWAFQPLTRPAVPAGPAGIHPIDAFLAEKLDRQHLQFNPEADPGVLLRRVTFDLIGLPPTPDELAAFTEACRTAGGTGQPFFRVVETLLTSPHYGERWARHWLDVVRFAESDGFEVNSARPNAWPYRDWVIESLNTDKPYDQFIREQICGDTCGADAATGFLVGGATDRVTSPDPVLTANQRADELHDMVSTTGSALLGMTIGCARCHDHKFDPISQRDYYAIKAAFAGVRHGEREIGGSLPESKQRRREEICTELESSGIVHLRPAVTAGRNIERLPGLAARHVRFTVLATTGAEPCLDELEIWTTSGRNAAREATVTSSGDLAGFSIHRLDHINDGLYGNEHSWISKTAGTGWVELKLPGIESIERIEWSRDRSPSPQFSDRLATQYTIAISIDGISWQIVAGDWDRSPAGSPQADVDSPASRLPAPDLLATITKLKAELAALSKPMLGYAGTFVDPAPTHRLFRGDPLQPREAVAPGGVAGLGPQWHLPETTPERDRRRALADWIASPHHPLTARVIVNRLWHYHFGTGLVDTPSDLGLNGGRPSHPELLDWLASELIECGWSLKSLHRLIVTSRAYRQASDLRPEAMAVDAQARLLWRYPPRRLEAEALRDAILAVSGSLNQQMGGPGFDLFEPNTNYVKVYATKTAFTADDFRRMVYQSKPRSELDTFFGPFDCPDAGQVQPKRTSSTTPLQAFNLLNGEFLLDQADRFAQRIKREVGEDRAAQIHRAVLLAFSREATAAEIAAGSRLIAEHGLPSLCRALYNANEFIMLR